MFATENPAVTHAQHELQVCGFSELQALILKILMLLLLSWSGAAAAQNKLEPKTAFSAESVPHETGVWLVTYGPGDLYWQRFGHNGIWIRDSDLGLDHIFNFGFFDFEQEKFFVRFLQGKMLYFSAAQPAEREFAQYIDENRSIRLQKLNLSAQESLLLADFLINEVQPENRNYLYDYYLNNCSTRVRDAIDFALGGGLRLASEQQPAEQGYRDHTRRLTASGFWLYLGIELVLGQPVDAVISRWDEFFIPQVLADGIDELQVTRAAGPIDLVEEDVLLYESTLKLPPQKPPSQWMIYFLISVLLIAIVGLLGKKVKMLKPEMVAVFWFALMGTAGSALVFFWLGTDHFVAANNWNLLLISPLGLLVFVQGLRKSISKLVLASSLVALLQAFLPIPPGQYTLDVLAFFLPLNLVAAWCILRSCRSEAALN